MKLTLLTMIVGSLLLSNCESSKKASQETQEEVVEQVTEQSDTTNIVAKETDEHDHEHDHEDQYWMKDASKDLIGTWEWTRTDCCGRMKNTKYADPVAEKETITFNADGTAMYYVSRHTAGQGAETGAYKYTIGDIGNQPTIKIGDIQPAIFYIQDDILILNWEYMDLQIEYYKRVN